MELEAVRGHGPQIVFGLAALGIMFLVMRYRRRHDLTIWMDTLRRQATRAVDDEAFRRAELADVEEELARYPVPETVKPMRRSGEMQLQLIPKGLFIFVFSGLFFTYMGLFQRQSGESSWEVILGLAILAVTGLLLLKHQRLRWQYGRVQQLNRKYLLQKAGGDPDRHDTIKEVLAYYPAIAHLWLEHADQLAVADRMDEALAAVRQARSLAPDNLDMAAVEVSFLLRVGEVAAAQRALDAFAAQPRVDSDPRLELYRSAAFLAQRDEEKALRNARIALEKDRNFCEKILPVDASLAGLAALLRAKGLLESPDESEKPCPTDPQAQENDSGEDKKTCVPG